jgi:hypothetical protein
VPSVGVEGAGAIALWWQVGSRRTGRLGAEIGGDARSPPSERGAALAPQGGGVVPVRVVEEVGR